MASMIRAGKATRPLSGPAGPARMMLIAFAAAVTPVSIAPAAMARPAAAIAAVQGPVESLIAARAPGELRAFYAQRGYRPVWFEDGALSQVADQLLEHLQSARMDGVNPRKLKANGLARAIRTARSGRPKDVAKAELALSRTYALYVRAMRAAPRAAMIYETQALAPVVPTPAAALTALTAVPSRDRFVAEMGWMHPLYAPMRSALLDRDRSPDERQRIARNLERLRAIPANPGRRYVLVDAAGARLWMYQDGKPVGSMKVVVGKADNQTPMMAGLLRHAIVNPYWNVPGDLVQQRIANNVIDKGFGYLRAGNYQVLSDWTERARPIDPARIDWRAVAAGSADQPRVRQLPGGANFMGKVKFEFPNAQGIYLHDTPDKHLMAEDARQLSSGCVRLEDAARLGRWLLDKPLPARVRRPEQRIELPEVVPVYITYLTAVPDAQGVALRDDVYALDAAPPGKRSRQRLARAGQAW